MTRKFAKNLGLGIGIGLATGLAVGSIVVSAADADKAWVVDNSGCKHRIEAAADGFVTEDEARYLTTHYLAQLGYSEPGNSPQAARLMDVREEGIYWRVGFKYGSHHMDKTAMFLVNRENGLIGVIGMKVD